MAGKSKKRFFGAFKSKRSAKRAEREHGAHILKRTIRGHVRYVVVKEER